MSRYDCPTPEQLLDRQLALMIVALMVISAALGFAAGYLAHIHHTQPPVAVEGRMASR